MSHALDWSLCADEPEMTRGDIWWADFGIPFGSEPDSSNIRTIVIVPLSGNVFLEKRATGLAKDSVVATSQMVSVDRERLIEKVSKIDSRLFAAVEEGMMTVLGIRRCGL